MTADSLTRARLDALLELLHADRHRAAQAYEDLRVRLVRFFLWRGVVPAEDGADETLDRVARRVEEGEQVRDPYRYVVGVARNVLREERARRDRETALRERWQVDTERALRSPATDAPEDEARLTCLAQCLARLGPETRRLVLDYHRGEKRERIARRRVLAESLGLTPVALRVRVHRLRQTIEACVSRCLERHAVTSSLPGPPSREG